MSKFYEESEFAYPNDKKEKSLNILFGDAWQARCCEGEYFVEYISGEHAGRLKELKITKDDYLDLSTKKITFAALLLKYGFN